MTNYGSVGIIERAYQLARSGTCQNMVEIRKMLRLEKYINVEMHLDGMKLAADLKKLCEESAPGFQATPQAIDLQAIATKRRRRTL